MAGDDTADHALAGSRLADQAQHHAALKGDGQLANEIDASSVHAGAEGQVVDRQHGYATLCRSRGSSATRTPSPRRLQASTVTMMQATGVNSTQTALCISLRASASICPQVVVSGGTDR